MTRPSDGITATGARDGPPRRVVTRVPGVPGGRAVVGGLLIALAGVGTFVSWQRASGTPDQSYAVADRALEPGEPVTSDAIRFVPIDLPADVAAAAFGSAAQLEGRVLVAPVGEGELLQRGALSDQAQAEPAAEVSIALARDLAVDGRLRAGDTVDVYATYDTGTELVASGVRVISGTESGGSFGDGRELTVTLALTDQSRRIPVINAARDGQVTLVRTTHVTRNSTSTGAGPPGEPPPAGPGAAQAPGGASTTTLAPRSGPPTGQSPSTTPPPAPAGGV
ncbi:MAG TPA: SAF domain-containing protein [Acidimicrobiales bacterium]|nr:SAF domain-containing protein [Acidimicrobiales bacterium]